jgi:hypothetical protein
MRVHLDVFGLAAHDIILGLLWLKESNSQIDWVNWTLSFGSNQRKRSLPIHQLCLMADEKTLNYIASLQIPRKIKRIDDQDIRTKPPDITETLEKRVTPDIPDEYKEFKKLFQEELGAEALPKH